MKVRSYKASTLLRLPQTKGWNLSIWSVMDDLVLVLSVNARPGPDDLTDPAV